MSDHQSGSPHSNLALCACPNSPKQIWLFREDMQWNSLSEVVDFTFGCLYDVCR